jgi:hypothetical protein
MKNLEIAKQIENAEVETSVASTQFADVIVYNEMADQTSVKLNLLEQINMQMNQIEEMTLRRQFVTREVVQQIIGS